MNSLLFDFTTANENELDAAWKAIAEEIGDDQFFTSRELASLPKLLAPYEQVLAFSSGIHESNTWLIVLTDQRIILLDKGIIYGLRQSTIELNRVNSIESKVGIMFGEISIGSNAKNYRITNVWKKTVNPFTAKVRQAQAAYDRGVQMHTPAYPPIAQRVPPEEVSVEPAATPPQALENVIPGASAPAFTMDDAVEPEGGAVTEHEIRMEKAGLNWRPVE